MTCNIYYSEILTDIGPITIARTKKGVCKLYYKQGEAVLRDLERWSRQHFLSDQIKRDDQALADAREELSAYFRSTPDNPKKSFECELDVYGTSFQQLVWEQLCSIPFGEVQTYKEVAQTIGAPKAVRAIGGACNRNNIPILIPCHRVIGSNGNLVGYGAGLHIKQKLLEKEGAL